MFSTVQNHHSERTSKILYNMQEEKEIKHNKKWYVKLEQVQVLAYILFNFQNLITFAGSGFRIRIKAPISSRIQSGSGSKHWF